MSDPRPFSAFAAHAREQGWDQAPVDHAERARNLLTTSESHAFAAEQDQIVAKAHVHATLALVEAQKDTNYLLGRIYDEMTSTRAVGL